MATVLVSIISEQGFANLVYYKQNFDRFDSLVFITTKQMEDKRFDVNLEIAMGVQPNTAKRVRVQNDIYNDIIAALESSGLSDNDEYHVNLTGGTKMMSIATYDFFKQKRSRLVYIPIGQHYFIDMENDHLLKRINYQVSLEEYLALYGIRYEGNRNLSKPYSNASRIFSDIVKKDFNLPLYIRNAHTYFSAPADRKYHSGEWFEEYVYNRIKNELGLASSQICMSAKIYREDSILNDNEIDVLFIKDNVLSIVECKVTMYGNGEPKKTVENYLYKIAAIAKDLGLKVNSYLFTMHNMNQFPEATLANFEKRRSILGITKIVDGKSMLNNKLPL